MSSKYIGYRQTDLNTPYAKFYQETIAAVPDAVSGALDTSGFAPGILPSIAQVADLHQPGYSSAENGFSLEPDGSARVAVLTAMPGVTPQMWDWWFGWHGSQDNRYKLWHPKAHLSAVWQDGKVDVAYIGRVSIIEEYIGKNLEKANIRFVTPQELGFPAEALADKNQVVYICARLGYTRLPVDFGWLVHQIRLVEGGAEMRSRFWMGGAHIQLRAKGWLPAFVSGLIQKLVKPTEQQARDILQHCSEEMNHLAGFLPRLYAEMHENQQP